MAESWTILKVLNWTTSRFERGGLDSPRLDAQVLLAHTLGCDRVQLYANFDKPMAPEELATYRGLIQRRLENEPVAYITGSQEFWSLRFFVDKRVLIPRPDTETLVQVALELGDSIGKNEVVRIVEVATGSGAVAISLAHERPRWTFVATDLSADALEVAAQNAEAHKVADRILFKKGDLLNWRDTETCDVLVANLPYIAHDELDKLPKSVQHEPTCALDGGHDGLRLIARLLDEARELVVPGGWIALEHGFDQGVPVHNLACEAGYKNVQTRDDMAGRARVTYCQR